MEIIPAIDIIEGKCVRLTQGDFGQKKIYHDNPLEIAKKFESAGIQRLHVVDLDGAKTGNVQNWDVLKQIASHTGLKIDFGGGIKDLETAGRILNDGASWITIGSMAVKDPATFDRMIETFGANKILLGADVKDHKVMISGWLEKTSFNIFEFIEAQIKKGISQIFCTDISKDGKLQGPSLELYAEIIERFPELYFIASGGVSKKEDLELLKAIGCKGAIVGKAIYENRISLEELASFHQQNI
jgi:phosphoribosylformimino-5-aminoimidazole carboxamide ribotide isomerase